MHDADSSVGNRAVPAPPWQLSLVIPAWNEEAVIAQAIEEAVTALAKVSQTFEVIVVDDGSTDRTAAIIESLAEKHQTVRLVRLPENQGYGAALRAGFESSRYDLVAFTDADCQFELANLEYMLPLSLQHDMVSGYRIDRQDPAIRRFYSWSYNTMVKVLFQSPLRDVDCALKVFRREALQEILPDSRTYFANTEMVTEARLRHFTIIEVGVKHRPRAAGKSKVSIREVPKTLAALLPYWWSRAQFPGKSATLLQNQRPSLLACLMLMLLSGFLLFQGLGHPLIEPDEGRYGEIAREMWATGDWVVPRLNGVPYLDKPPLFYWMCAGSYSLFGVDDSVARLVPAIAAWLTIIATYLFGCRLVGSSASFFGSLALTLSFGFMCCGRFLILDSVLALFVTTSLFAAHEAIRHRNLQWGWWLASAVLCGLGVMTKGPVALILLGPPVVAHLWLNRYQQIRPVVAWGAYVGVVAAIATPWYVAVSIAVPEFVRYFFWEHNVNRFLTGSNHPAPMWYYIPVLLLGCMPWGLLLFPLTKYLMDTRESIRRMRTVEVGFLVLWAGWCLAFFSVASSKLPTYILPCIPAVMLLLGHFVQVNCSPLARDACQRVKAHAVFLQGVALLSLAGIVLAVVLMILGLEGRYQTAGHLAAWITLLLFAAATRQRVAPAMICGVFCCGALFATTKLAHDVFPSWARQHAVLSDSENLVDSLRDSSNDVPVACIAGNWGSVAFYLEREDVIFIDNSDLEDVTEFVDDQRSSLLVVKSDVDDATLQSLLPPQAEIHRISSNDTATVIAVRVPSPLLFDVRAVSAESDISPVDVTVR